MRFSLLAFATVAVAQVSTVISDLNNIKTQTDALTAALQKYQGGVAAGVPILSATNKLKTATQDTIKAAQSAGTVSTSDQADVLKAAEALYPSIIQSLDATVQKLPLFQKAGLSGTATQSLKSLQGLSAQLSSVLVSKATGDFKTASQTLASAIASAFSSALAGKAPTSQALPPIPSAGGSGGSSSSSSKSSAAAKPTSKASSSSAKASSYSTSAASTPAASTPAASPTPAPAPATTAAPAPSVSAPPPTFTGAAGKAAANVGGAVLLAAAAFAL